MKCQICGRPARKNSIVCSDNCNDIRLLIMNLSNKYTPTNGCDNCWGDLHQGCTDKCKQEFKNSTEFIKELYNFIRLVKNK